jgi:hypothetical protein
LQLATLVTSCTMFVRGLNPRAVIERSEQKLPDGLNGGPSRSVLDDVKKLRAKIASLNIEKLRISQAPEPKPDLKRQLRNQVSALANAAAPELLLQRGKVAASFLDRRGEDFMRPDYPAALLCLLFRAQMTQMLEAMVDALPERGRALSTAEQTKELNRIDAGLAKLEFQEEALIELAFAGGTDIPRRAGASPLAILGIKVISPAAQGPTMAETEAEIDRELAEAEAARRNGNGSASAGAASAPSAGNGENSQDFRDVEAEIDAELAAAGAEKVTHDIISAQAPNEPTRQRRPRQPRQGAA